MERLGLAFPDLRVVGIASNGEELLERLLEWSPRIVLQDLLMPGGIDGIETTRRIRALAPLVRVIALTASLDEARMIGVLRAGAAGYVRKDADPEILLAAVRAVAAGRTYIDPAIDRLALEMMPLGEELTARELQVLRLLAMGRANKEIAEVLSITEETVKTHVGHVLAKLGATSRTQALVRAQQLGLV